MPVPSYTPMPSLLPSALEYAGHSLRQRSNRVPFFPLGLREELLKESVPNLSPRIVIPTDTLIAAWRGLFPPERMMMLGGRTEGGLTRVTSARDVTSENRSSGYVKASPGLLNEALLDFEATGVRLVGWLHSHPGTGRGAVSPSHIDRDQDEKLCRDFGKRILGLIATSDGWLRGFGKAIESQRIAVDFEGRAIHRVEGGHHVYRLVVR